MLTEELVSQVVTFDPEDTDGSHHDDLDTKPSANRAPPSGIVVEGLQALLKMSCMNFVQDLFQNLVKPYGSQESWMILARSCKYHVRFLQDLERCFNFWHDSP